MTSALLHYGYAAIVLGTFLEGELVLLTAGALVQAGELSLLPVVLAGALGSAVWGQTWFHAGRISGPLLLAKRPAWRDRARIVERWLSSSGLWVLLAGRFAPGMGMVLPAMIGVSGVSRARFLAADLVGAVIWALGFSCAGVGAGTGWSRLRGSSRAELGWLVAAALVLGLAWLWRSWARRSRRESPAEEQPAGRRRVIITGDDFGLAPAVNEAIERAHRNGVLTTTSLMVGERAAKDAAARALRNPQLRVGLHVTLCEGLPTLRPSEIPWLVDNRGELRSPAAALISFLLLAASARFRGQLEAEIRAQFAAFRELGLTLDHVNAHNNLQLHPVVLPILMRVAGEYGVRAIRVPYEPLIASFRASKRRPLARLGIWLVMGSWATFVKGCLRRAGFVVNDYLFGVVDCGHIDSELLRSMIEHLPFGTTEIHLHPAAYRCPELERTAADYSHEDELAALTDPLVRRALTTARVEVTSGFAALSVAVPGSATPT